jgi:hypothetical protein
VTLILHPDQKLIDSQVVYYSDFDFLGIGNVGEEFFMIQVVSDQNYYNSILTARLIQEGEQLAFLRTAPFTLPAGEWLITNIDLAEGNYDFEGTTEPIRIADSGIEEELEDKIKNNLYSSGQLPTGYYEVKVELTASELTTPIQATYLFVITNPYLINLVAPGSQIGYGVVQEIFTEFPVFQWNGSSGDYQVLVFEKKSEFSSLDDILNNFPNWESERLNSLAVQYPVSGVGSNSVIPLEFGKIYYWLVKSFIQTSSGMNEILSEIWQFSLVDPASMGSNANDLAKENILMFLKQHIGTQEAEEIAKKLAEFNLNSIKVNGQSISVQDLYEIVDQYRGSDLEIQDLILQQSN